MKRSIIITVILVCTALFTPLKADELDDFRAGLGAAIKDFKDLKATVAVVDSSRRELEKMGKVFAETYQFKKATVWFKGPDSLKLKGEMGMMKAEFVTTDNTRLVRIPTIRFKKSEDISDQPEKHMSSLDVGVMSDSIWDIYQVKLVRTEKDGSGKIVYVLNLQTPTSKKYQMIWVDGKDFKLLRRDRLLDDGSIKVKAVFSEHKEFDGVWVPTRAEIYNGEGKLAATTEMKDIETNISIKDEEFK